MFDTPRHEYFTMLSQVRTPSKATRNNAPHFSEICVLPLPPQLFR